MDRLGHLTSTGPMTEHTSTAPHRLSPDTVLKALDKRTYAVMATTSPAGFPHTAGVLYQLVGTQLYTSTMRDSHKARNLAQNPRAAVTVPVRRMPVGAPPSAVQFQATVEILDLDDPELRKLAAAGRLKKVTGHGELELPGGCFLRITPRSRLNTYGLGMSLLQLARDPLNAGGFAELAA